MYQKEVSISDIRVQPSGAIDVGNGRWKPLGKLMYSDEARIIGYHLNYLPRTKVTITIEGDEGCILFPASPLKPQRSVYFFVGLTGINSLNLLG